MKCCSAQAVATITFVFRAHGRTLCMRARVDDEVEMSLGTEDWKMDKVTNKINVELKNTN